MSRYTRFLAVFIVSLSASFGYSQVSILSHQVNEYNTTPAALCGITVINNGLSEEVFRVQASLKDASGALVSQAISHPVRVNTGVNVLFGNISIDKFNYGNSPQAPFLRANHILPDGSYTYCVELLPVSMTEWGDDYCEDIISEFNTFLTLVSPFEGDTIDTPNPLLVWTHNGSFGTAGGEEYYRMILVELKEGQNADNGIIANPPLFHKNRLRTHQDMYPFDAKSLQPGQRYGWQVQKVSNGRVTQTSEAWDFVLREPEEKEDIKYISLKKKPDATVIPVYEKLYFRFDEPYQGQKITCRVFDNKNEEIKPNLKHEEGKGDEMTTSENLKNIGYNRYELDILDYNLSNGVYTVQIYNEKKEKFLVKIKVD